MIDAASGNMVRAREAALSRTSFERRADGNLPGSSLRNEAADYLEAMHGNTRVEVLVGGKKVDIVCEVREYGKATDLYVEVKDYSGHLQRNDVVQIFADYSGIVGQGRTARLLLVTRAGLSPSAGAFVDSQPAMFHQTIWELEDSALGLLPYVEAQASAFEAEGLDAYYIPARAQQASYDHDQQRTLDADDEPLFEVIQSWLAEERAPPIAILGGYGAGKSSFAKRVLSDQANKALTDPAARRPVLIKLGNITRSTGLDSLLGSLFTSEYEVRGYSFRRFKTLNAKGRLLIILDGFDEMKHAMTWTEFRNEIAELNALNEGNARVMLLGRPSAFTSDDEHLEVLRGRRRVAGGTRRLLEWPEFREYELSPFTRAEREAFVVRFLEKAETDRARLAGLTPDPVEIARRAAEVNALADQEDEVFGKPVHSRILVELALDPDFDLQSFARSVTRWSLYSEFFALLARRETLKPARSPIGPDYRLEFLRRVAVWLWQARDGATSFRASDLPAHVMADLPAGDTETNEEKAREYLAGAFLERKSGETFFFAHRSFAEFLVAEHLTRNPPASHQHEAYDSLIRDGVAVFLAAAPAPQGVGRWASTLSADSGQLSAEYVLLMEEAAGGQSKLAKLVPAASCWSPFLQLVAIAPQAADRRRPILADVLLKGDRETVLLVILSAIRFPGLLNRPKLQDPAPHPLKEFSDVVAAALITRLVAALREQTPMARHTIVGQAKWVLDLAKVAITIEQREESRSIVFSWRKLESAARSQAGSGVSLLKAHPGDDGYGTIVDERLPYIAVRNLMPTKISGFFHQMVLKRCTLDTISVVEQSERRSG